MVSAPQLIAEVILELQAAFYTIEKQDKLSIEFRNNFKRSISYFCFCSVLFYKLNRFVNTYHVLGQTNYKRNCTLSARIYAKNNISSKESTTKTYLGMSLDIKNE